MTMLFGSPYTALALEKMPSVLVAYEVGDVAETAVARALMGEAPIGGRLPVTLGKFPFGHGLTRTAASAAAR